MFEVTDLIATGGITEWLDSFVTIEFSWTILILLVVTLIALGEPLYVLLGAITCYLLLTLPDFPPVKPMVGALNTMIEETRVLSDKVELLAIPFFVLAGAIMTAGDIAHRLINVAKATFGWLPGGLGISAVGACMFFAAISGSSPVTVIAIGTMMYPVLLEDGYSEKFSSGVLTSAGSLGILIPPSIPMLIFAIVLGQLEQGWAVPSGPDGLPAYGILAESGLDPVGALFLAGVGPGILIGGALGFYSYLEGKRRNVKTTDFDWRVLWTAVQEGFWALMLPFLILGGIYTGTFTVTQAAAVAVVYSLVVELFIHGGLELKALPRIFAESAVLMGTLLIIIAMALGFNRYLVKAEVPDMAVDLILDWNLGPLGFLLVMNILLLIVGCLMDIMSAILILVPLLAPVALELGIHPVHLAIIFIVNLEIGYLTPPLGLNLFVASTIFKKPIGEIVVSVLPFTGILLGCVFLVTYVPAISLGPLAIMAGKSPFIGFEETISPSEAEKLREEMASTPVGAEKSLAEINKELSTTVEGMPDVLDIEYIDMDAQLELMDVAEWCTPEQMNKLLSWAETEVLDTDQFIALSVAINEQDEDTREAYFAEILALDDEGIKARVESIIAGEDDDDDDEDDEDDGGGGMMPDGGMPDMPDDDEDDEDEDDGGGGMMPGMPDDAPEDKPEDAPE